MAVSDKERIEELELALKIIASLSGTAIQLIKLSRWGEEYKLKRSMTSLFTSIRATANNALAGIDTYDEE